MNGIINYPTTLGCILMIRHVTVIPKERAMIKCIYVDPGHNEKHNIEISGEEYARWGENDDYLGVICLQKINPADKIMEVVSATP
jgi:hypothetical protein